MKVQVSEATPLQLNWMVCLATGVPVTLSRGVLFWTGTNHVADPITNWAQGGPIIELGHPNYPGNKMEFRQGNTGIYASYWRGPTWWGPTHLIAAMRCFVAHKLGNEVEIPEELK